MLDGEEDHDGTKLMAGAEEYVMTRLSPIATGNIPLLMPVANEIVPRTSETAETVPPTTDTEPRAGAV
jgi:hypothetical protein